jgi:hypothetical protein
MPVDRAALAAFVREVGRFYVRDRRLRRAQAALDAKLAADAAPDDAEVARYLEAVKTYFTGFEREARARLRDVDRRLARVSQLQFNLTAERGVTARRVEVTRKVLERLAELGR